MKSMETLKRQLPLGVRLATCLQREKLGMSTRALKVKFFPTYRCDLKCRHCNLWKDRGTGELGLDAYLRMLKTMPECGIISISGGEPFLRDDISGLLAAASRKPHLAALSINTNGFRTEAIVSAVESLLGQAPGGLKIRVFVSIDGPEKVHDEIRRRRGAHACAERTITRLSKLHAPALTVSRNICVSPYNLAHMEDYLARLAELGGPVNLFFYQVSAHYMHAGEDAKAVAEFQREAAARMRSWPLHKLALDSVQREYLETAGSFLSGKTRGQPMPCSSGLAALIVDPRGDVYPCINYHRKIGNIKDMDCDLEKLARTPGAREVRRSIRRQRCPICWTPNDAYVSILANHPLKHLNPNHAIGFGSQSSGGIKCEA